MYFAFEDLLLAVFVVPFTAPRTVTAATSDASRSVARTEAGSTAVALMVLTPFDRPFSFTVAWPLLFVVVVFEEILASTYLWPPVFVHFHVTGTPAMGLPVFSFTSVKVYVP